MSRRDRQQFQLPQAPAAASEAVLPGTPAHVRFETPVLVGSAVITALDLAAGGFEFEALASGWVLFSWRGQRVAVPREHINHVVLARDKEP